MASPRTKLQHSHTPLLQQNTLDGGLRLSMLRRFSRPNRAAWTRFLRAGQCC